MTVYDPEPPPAEPEGNEPLDVIEPQRRVRHITAIQVRNLTPFPARDTLATALQQPADQPQFNELGGLSDDLDVTIGRRRGRRVSTSSVNTLSRLRNEVALDEVEEPTSGSPEARKRTMSRGSLQSVKSLRRSSHTASSPSTSPGSVRALKARTNSSATMPSTSTSAITLPHSLSTFSTHSQTGLEAVVSSRLVETFMTLRIPPKPSPPTEPISPPSSPPPVSPASPRFAHKRIPSSLGQAGARSRTSAALPNGKTPDGPLSPRGNTSRHNVQPSISENGGTIKASQKFSSAKAHPSSPSRTPSPSSSPTHTRLTQPTPAHPQTPDYISPFHRPSTNPKFTLDAQAAGDFGAEADLGADRVMVAVWGRVVSGWGASDAKDNGKGKAKELSHPALNEEARGEWKILSEWDVDLTQLVPLPDDIHPSKLPANTLLCTLSPPDQTFYLPISSLRSPASSRRSSPSPSAGYNSDPEGHGTSTLRARKPHGRESQLKRGRTRGSRMKEGKTATFQDLVKLVTLEAVIRDTRQSLADVVQDCDQVLRTDGMSVLKREVNEREFAVRTLVEQRENVQDRSADLQARTEELRARLRSRRQILETAREILVEDLRDEADQASIVEDERRSHALLEMRLQPVRTTLINTLASIFPIELLSPPDLLYTILSVPLPIPLSASEPAPPLVLATHPEVSEDSVASALGYGAQVVQLLAAYLGRLLVYPITCCGSRSLIKDPISAMMGPRMFPLYSKGVDTYRFEYAVYLLNKDIEMLMSDRNLRALDLRHTLPNLKNLLLTLTSGEQASLRRISESPFPTATALDKRSSLSSIPELSLTPDMSTSTVTLALTDPVSSDTPSGSTSKANEPSVTLTTTLASASFSSRAKPYLGFGISPLAGFLRARYPTSAREPSVVTVKETEAEVEEDGEEGEGSGASSSGQDEDEEEESDRRTLRGAQGVLEGGGGEVKRANGNAVEGEDVDTPSGEKTPTHSTVPSAGVVFS